MNRLESVSFVTSSSENAYPSLDSMLSHSESPLWYGLKRIQENPEKDSRPRTMMDFSREATGTTRTSSEWWPDFTWI